MFAGSWSGSLVDSKCYASEERNVNPQDTLTYVDRDKDQQIRRCSPGPKTKSFALVEQDGLSFKLDSAGNTEASELVRKMGRKSLYSVTITGEIGKNTIKVNSISLAR